MKKSDIYQPGISADSVGPRGKSIYHFIHTRGEVLSSAIPLALIEAAKVIRGLRKALSDGCNSRLK
jgi:hypothetical protein